MRTQIRIFNSADKAIKKNNETLNVMSLFSGCGGMDLGFEGGFLVHKNSINGKISSDFIEAEQNNHYVRLKKNRFKTIFANDILSEAQSIWNKNFLKIGANQDSFLKTSIVDLVKLHQADAFEFPENVDIVTGGFPCQDFSVAGKRMGFNSEKSHNGVKLHETEATIESRGQLYIWMKSVIDIVKPKIFIAENVKGLVNLSNVKEVIKNDFSNADGGQYFVFDPKILHAADYGVPQSRERVFFIGIRKDALNPDVFELLKNGNIPPNLDPYPPKTHSYTNKRDEILAEPLKLGDILLDLPEPENSDDPSHMYYSSAKFMGKHCQGQIEIKLDSIGPTIRSEHHGNIEFRRLSIENGGKLITELQSGLKQRRLTPRECGLIQTFPPDFEFVIPSNLGKKKFEVSPSQAYKVIGNAVPPLLAYHIAKRIESLWNVYFS